MKRFFCLLLTVLMVISLVACQKTDKVDEPIVTEETSANKQELFPSPKQNTFEDSENNLGARYNFTLKEFNDMFNDRCKNLGTTQIDEFLEYDNWEKMSDTLLDDNGIEYTSYYYATDTLTMTAAIENESGKVMNLGCGTTYSEFVDSDADYQYTVMLTSAIMAMVAGEYDDSALEFLYYIFFDSAKNDTAFFYNNSVYMLNLSKAEGVEGSVVLFMMSPCKDEILSEWELTDYKKFESSARNTK